MRFARNIKSRPLCGRLRLFASGAGPGFHRRKHYPKTGCPTLRGFRSVGIPAAVTARFSRQHPSAATFFHRPSIRGVHRSQPRRSSPCYISAMPNRLHRYYGAGYSGAGPGFHRRKHYPKTGCPTLRGFRSVGIPAAVAERFSRLHPSAAAFFTGRLAKHELFHRFIGNN